MTADVDVIVPVRNGGKLLRDAVDSVLTQEGVAVRVVVVDDGSTDSAPDRLPPDPRLVVIPNRGHGIPAALNTAIAAGGAPLVARQDADDRSLPGRLAAEAEHLERHPGIGLVSTAFEVVVGDRVVATMGPGPAGMLARNPICAGSTVVRREVIGRAGNYREAFRLSSDYDAWLRCVWVEGFSVLPVVGYQYRLTATMSTISRAGAQQRFAELARASARARIGGLPDPVEELGDRADDLVEPPGADGERRRAQAEVAAWWAHEFAALGARREAIRCARSAARSLPARRAVGLARVVLGRPAPQGAWS